MVPGVRSSVTAGLAVALAVLSPLASRTQQPADEPPRMIDLGGGLAAIEV